MLKSIVDLASARPGIGQSTTVDPVVLCAADEKYAMPLAVTLVSAAEHLQAGHSLQVHVVDGGMSDGSKARLLKSLDGYPLQIEFVDAQAADLSDLQTSHHITHTAYLRLLADRWLPSDLEKVIYLDSDLVVLSSLTELWERDLAGNFCLAVPDIACPFVDAHISASQMFRKSLPYLATWKPIPNYDELGVDPHSAYFNSGVMVLNLKRWREEALGDRLMATLRENAEHVWCWDQYALNALCTGQWGQLPPHWNVGAHAFEFPAADCSPISREDYEEMLERPAVMHFTTEFKPWDYYCTHPRRDLFFKFLDKTEWRGWRPVKPKFRIRDWWNRRAVSTMKHLTINYRKLILKGAAT